MYQFKITNISPNNPTLNLDALKAYFHTEEKCPFNLEYEDNTVNIITYNHAHLSISNVKSALLYQPTDRFLLEYVGSQRHAKIVYQEGKTLAWASYDMKKAPDDLINLNLPFGSLEKQNDRRINSTPVAYFKGALSGRSFQMKGPPRDTMTNLAKYGSWFNQEKVILEIVRPDRFDALTFENGVVREKRGINYHDDFEDTVKWLGFEFPQIKSESAIEMERSKIFEALSNKLPKLKQAA